MSDFNPMFHMDQDYMWRWFITNAHGGLVSMSAGVFFDVKDARRDLEAACLLIKQAP